MFRTKFRTAIAVLAVSLGFASAVPAASQAFPIAPQPTGKSCKTPEGIVIQDGQTGTSGGKTYSCKNGIGCQVENGKVTDKCSHMEALRRLLGTDHVAPVLVYGR
jgi:hypothetical protein